MIRVLSMSFDGTYTIQNMLDLPYADRYANRHVNQLHFLEMRGAIMQWVGEHIDSPCWYAPTNPVQAKLAKLYFTLEPA